MAKFSCKMQSTATHDRLHTCLGHFGPCDTDRIIAICVTLPKLARARRAWHNCRRFCGKLHQCKQSFRPHYFGKIFPLKCDMAQVESVPFRLIHTSNCRENTSENY